MESEKDKMLRYYQTEMTNRRRQIEALQAEINGIRIASDLLEKHMRDPK